VLAYVFWHGPLEGADRASYERAHHAFLRSLARTPPVGLLASAAFRVARAPWLADAPEPLFEDWYLVEDYAALGVLNEAAVGRGHQSTHDEVARRYGGGAGALYGLIEGEAGARALASSTLAVWISRPPGGGPGSRRRGLDELLGDGMDARAASLWRRQLVLGPAPEFCLLASEEPAGVAASRLPRGWSATTLAREALGEPRDLGDG